MYTLPRYTFSNVFITESVDSFYSPKNEASKILRSFFFFQAKLDTIKNLRSSQFFFLASCIYLAFHLYFLCHAAA